MIIVVYRSYKGIQYTSGIDQADVRLVASLPRSELVNSLVPGGPRAGNKSDLVTGGNHQISWMGKNALTQE